MSAVLLGAIIGGLVGGAAPFVWSWLRRRPRPLHPPAVGMWMPPGHEPLPDVARWKDVPDPP